MKDASQRLLFLKRESKGTFSERDGLERKIRNIKEELKSKKCPKKTRKQKKLYN